MSEDDENFKSQQEMFDAVAAGELVVSITVHGFATALMNQQGIIKCSIPTYNPSGDSRYAVNDDENFDTVEAFMEMVGDDWGEWEIG